MSDPSIEQDMSGWYFTFGQGTPMAHYYLRIAAPDRAGARRAMHRLFGRQWAFDYSGEQFAEQPAKYNLQPFAVLERLVDISPFRPEEQ